MNDPKLRPHVIEIEDEAAPTTPVPCPQVIETKDARPIESPPAAQQFQETGLETTRAGARTNGRGGTHAGRIALSGLMIMVVGLLCLNTFNWLASQFYRSSLLGGLSVIAVGAGLIGVAYWAILEVRAVVAMRSAEQAQLAVSGMSASQPDLDRDISHVLARLEANAATRAGTILYTGQLQPHHTAIQRIELLSRLALAPADKLAKSTIRAAALQTVALTAISPTPITDTAVFIVRATRMIRAIAEAYGHHPGLAATLHLVRRVLINASMIGAADLAGEYLARQFKGVLESLTGFVPGLDLEKLTATAGESLFAAHRMARIGLLTMKLCRPVAFGPDEAPSATNIVGWQK
jgi:putative membrane protein